MRAFVFEDAGVVAWRNVCKPSLSPYGAILRPLAVAPCTSDVHTVFEGGTPKMKPHILGHESVAQILYIGPLVRDFQPGEIVAVPAITPDWRALGIQEGNIKHAGAPFSGHQLGRTQPGVFAEQFAIQDADTTLAHIPDGVTVEQALMCVDMMTTGFTGAEYADISIGDRVCVIGIGPVGLMAIAGARLQGASEIFAVGSRRVCVELALHFGATHILNYKEQDVVSVIKDWTNGQGVDSVILCGGGDEAFSQAVDMVRYGVGTISNVNYFGGTGALHFPKFSGGRGMAGKTLHTELAAGGRMRIERLLRMVKAGRIDPAPLVTHRYKGLSQIENALYAMRDKPADLVKAVVHIDWDSEEVWDDA